MWNRNPERADDMVSRKVKVAASSALMALFALAVIAGVYREEFWDIIANATMLCYSCIGLK